MKKILILGSGALKIGQAGEFDYSGSQAIKALKEEGIQTVVINPNIATVQTSIGLADDVYFLPVTPYFVEEVIKKERPNGILLSFGGQTALNCGVELHKKGVFDTYNISILGSPIESIILTEDRERFAHHLKSIHQSIPRSIAAVSVRAAKAAAKKIGYPAMIRAAYALGGQSSGIVHNEEELVNLATEAFSHAPQILVEKYLHHFKEIEYEVVRDADDNCITVCNMENFDPLGIHTGESIVVAPSQTLNNHEFHTLRQASIDIVRSLGIVGECNIQFALNPDPPVNPETNDIPAIEYFVIEVNARLSRSSALASKATGYPLAYVAAKLAIGKKLSEIANQVTQVTQSMFEPALDYCVVKIPRWDIEKFRGAEERIGSSMKSVGEVMGIGRTFGEAIQKAVRMLEINLQGVTDWSTLTNGASVKPEELYERHIVQPTPKRLYALTYAMFNGKTVEELHDITGIDCWFLEQLSELVEVLKDIKRHRPILRSLPAKLERSCLLLFKQYGYSDVQIATEIGVTEADIRIRRKRLGVKPFVFQIDTLAAEFPAATNYLYTTYQGFHQDVVPLHDVGVIVLGSGPYRIGSSVEFDWSCVSAAGRLAHYHKKSIIINCNPETVSTDYDMSDRLYFEELTLERVLDIAEFEQSHGVVVSVGGQTPNNLAVHLTKNNIPVLGTSTANIDRAEDRSAFSAALDKLGLLQPEWGSVTTIEQAKTFAERVGYPVLIRPSYVLSGSAMKICYAPADIQVFLQYAVRINAQYPVTISKFVENAKEIEFDAVACKGELMTYAISEHIEYAGVHSGDATIVFPASEIYIGTQQQILRAAVQLAREFSISGPFNIQFLGKHNEVSIIEMNLRASRTFPFVSKAIGINISSKIVDAIFGSCKKETYAYPAHSVVKVPQFSFSRLHGADPVLHVEMASTGEVACFGYDREEAYLKGLLAVGFSIPERAILLSLGDTFKSEFVEEARTLKEAGFAIYATLGTSVFLKKFGISSKVVRKGEGKDRGKEVLKLITRRKVDLVINLGEKIRAADADIEHIVREQTDGFKIRRAASDHSVPLITNLNTAKLLVSAIRVKRLDDLSIMPLREYVAGVGKTG